MANEKNDGIEENGKIEAGNVGEQGANAANDGSNGANDSGVGSSNDGGSAGSGSGDGNGNAGDNGEKTFTQSEVSAMMAKEKRQGFNAAFNKLGIDPEDKDSIAMIQSFAKSRGEQGSAEGNDGGGNEELQRELMAERMKVEAMKQGAKPNCVDDLVTLAIAGMTEDADMKTLIGEYKTKYPDWFGLPDGDDEKNAGKKGTGSSLSASGKSGADDSTVKGMGERLAASRKGKGGKSSYFRGK